MKKRILIMQPELCVGGVEKVLLTLLAALDRSKYEISLLLRNPSAWDEKIAEDVDVQYLFTSNPRRANGIVYRLYKYSLIFLPGVLLRWIFGIGKYDLYIAFHEPMIHLLKAARGKKIAWIHADYSVIENIPEVSELKNKSGLLARSIISARQWVHNGCDRIVCVAESAAMGFSNRYGHFNGRIVALHNPQDRDQILDLACKPLERRDLPRPIFCTVGRFSPEKAYYRIVQAAARLNGEGYEFSVVMVGDGATRAAIERGVEEAGISKSFLFTGFESNPYRHLVRSDCLLSCSLYEAFSTVACESLILGVPVITTSCSGMGEIIGESNAGIIVPNEDAGIYGAMKMVLDDVEMLSSMRKEARRRGEFFDRSASVARIEAMIDEVLLEGENGTA